MTAKIIYIEFDELLYDVKTMWVGIYIIIILGSQVDDYKHTRPLTTIYKTIVYADQTLIFPLVRVHQNNIIIMYTGYINSNN